MLWALALGVACTLLMAPQTTEFGAKVGLLAGLVVMCPLRGLFERRQPAVIAARRAMSGPVLLIFARGAAIGASLVLAGSGRGGRRDTGKEQPPELPAATGAPLEVEVGELPPVSVGDEVAALSGEAASEADGLLLPWPRRSPSRDRR